MSADIIGKFILQKNYLKAVLCAAVTKFTDPPGTKDLLKSLDLR